MNLFDFAAIVPGWGVIAAFALAAFVLAITPGPDMTLFLSRTLASGRSAGLMCLMGAMTGILVHTTLAVLGVSALIAASAKAFFVLKLAGAAYLAWLAVQALRHRSALTLPPPGTVRTPASLKRAFASGLGINLLNPKIVLFYMTFLPQFVSAADPHATGKMAFLGVFFLAIGTPVCVAIIFAAERFAATLSGNPRVARALDYVFASVFGVFAIRILFTQAR